MQNKKKFMKNMIIQMEINFQQPKLFRLNNKKDFYKIWRSVKKIIKSIISKTLISKVNKSNLIWNKGIINFIIFKKIHLLI